MEERLYPLDADALALFARKGQEGGPTVPQAGEANGVKVRRVLQITRDLAGRPFGDLRVLDLGCGDGVYAIEAGLRGAQVVALDARTQRMEQGAACAARHGLDNVVFRQGDVRRVSRATDGEFDVIYFLGLLYHLDIPDVFGVLENVRDMCTGLVVFDTLISLEPTASATHRGRHYDGDRVREHGDNDSRETRRSRVLRSIDNTFAFRFTRASLVALLHDVGFSSAFECLAPPEPLKADDRITMVARRGERVTVSTYPWVNDLSEDEVTARLEAMDATTS
jgi:SAM-dependent methyltransferase